MKYKKNFIIFLIRIFYFIALMCFHLNTFSANQNVESNYSWTYISASQEKTVAENFTENYTFCIGDLITFPISDCLKLIRRDLSSISMNKYNPSILKFMQQFKFFILLLRTGQYQIFEVNSIVIQHQFRI